MPEHSELTAFESVLDSMKFLPPSYQKTSILRDYENGILTESQVHYAFYYLDLDEA